MLSIGSGRCVETLLRCFSQRCRARAHAHASRPGPLLRHASSTSTTSTSTSTSAPPPSAPEPRKRTRHSWTVQEDDLLIQSRKAGVPYHQLFFQDRTVASMVSRLKRLAEGIRGELVALEARDAGVHHLPRTFLSDSQKADIARLRAAGSGPARIARQLNLAPYHISRYWQLLDNHIEPAGPITSPVEAARTPYSIEEDRLLHDLKLQGMTWPQIARRVPSRTKSSLQSRWAAVLLQRTNGQKRSSSSADTTVLRTGRFDLTEDVRLLEMSQQGLSPVAIARRIGRSPRSVYGAIGRLDITRRPAESTHALSQRVGNILNDKRSRLDSNGAILRSAPGHSSRAYSAAEIFLLKNLIQDSCPSPYIARYLGRKTNAIKCKVQALALIRNPLSQDQKEAIRACREQGLESHEIAAKLGHSEHCVRGNLHMMPLERYVE